MDKLLLTPTEAATALGTGRSTLYQLMRCGTVPRQAAGPAWTDSGLVFTTEVGTPLEPRNVLRRFDALARRAGLEGVHLHTLGHSAASFLLAAGTHTKVVQEQLGHSSYAITADIYSHVAPTQAREAADRLDQAIEW